MAYRIEYGQTMTKMEFCDKEIRCKKHISLFLIIAAILSAIYIANSDEAQDIIIPGDAQVTKKAFTELTDDLRNGEDIKSAITAFCQEIVDGANIS